MFYFTCKHGLSLDLPKVPFWGIVGAAGICKSDTLSVAGVKVLKCALAQGRGYETLVCDLSECVIICHLR